MNRKMVKVLLLIGCVTIMSAGCAKKEMVKSEEPVVPPAKTVEAPTPVTPANEQAAPETSAVKEEALPESGKEVPAAAMQTVYFNFDSYVLSTEARDILKTNAQWMQKNSDVKIQVQGNCDERGSAEYNLALGENRAKAAVKYLTTLGIKPARLSFISFGKEKPADPGHDEAAWAKNRRDDFFIVR